MSTYDANGSLHGNDGKFTEQQRAEAAQVSLHVDKDGKSYVVSPDPVQAFASRADRARDRFWSYMAIRDLSETLGDAAHDDGFDESEAVYATLTEDRDDDGYRCSLVGFYDANGHLVSEYMQGGYLADEAPPEFVVDTGTPVGSAVSMAKVSGYDWGRPAREYAQELRESADELDRRLADQAYAAHLSRASADCPRCGSPSDAPDPTCSLCPDTGRVACYAGQCTYIAADDADLDRHVADECEYAGEGS